MGVLSGESRTTLYSRGGECKAGYQGQTISRQPDIKDRQYLGSSGTSSDSHSPDSRFADPACKTFDPFEIFRTKGKYLKGSNSQNIFLQLLPKLHFLFLSLSPFCVNLFSHLFAFHSSN